MLLLVSLSLSISLLPSKQKIETQEQLPRPDLRKLAELAKVSLTDDQIKDFQPKVDRVVDWYVSLPTSIALLKRPPSD